MIGCGFPQILVAKCCTLYGWDSPKSVALRTGRVRGRALLCPLLGKIKDFARKSVDFRRLFGSLKVAFFRSTGLQQQVRAQNQRFCVGF